MSGPPLHRETAPAPTMLTPLNPARLYARGAPVGILSGSLVQVCPWTPAGRATRLTPVRTPGPATESQNTALTLAKENNR